MWAKDSWDVGEEVLHLADLRTETVAWDIAFSGVGECLPLSPSTWTVYLLVPGDVYF